ncbi:MAG: DGQHR domain-containing protein [Flavobacteriia bacterium]|jgi:DGQHR domain-containing protein|uniref:DGQHR domain-containing protein n=1 Tax=Flavobacterium sp. TaxID=239 RepID=UPI0029777C6C|nr:MAG: DGQHR domain-containing protein [Flavobacteriia bacterium]
MAKEKFENIKCPAIKGKVLGVKVYRGYLKLSDLSFLSKADVYDAKNNPTGTQRDLSPKHAKEAYEYVKNNDLGFWPEVFLCARNNSIITFNPISDEYSEIGLLEFETNKILESKQILLSRVDGNHRLHYGNSSEKGFNKIDKEVSFCIAFDLTREEEIKLFKDINKNQKPMNTSHLDGIDVRLSPEEELKRRQPELFIGKKLGTDSESPFFERIYDGGKKPVGVDIPLRAIKTGLIYMFSKSTQLSRLNDTDAQYKVIKNYFSAVKQWIPNAWSTPKDFLALRGVGLWSICYLGSQVIDRGLINSKFDTQTFLDILNSGKEWDWSNKGDFKGYSGAQGAQEISNKIARHLKDTNQISTQDLLNEIMKD